MFLLFFFPKVRRLLLQHNILKNTYDGKGVLHFPVKGRAVTI